mgnify:FL=1
MASKKDMQSEVMALIDMGKAMMDKVLSILPFLLSSPSFSANFSTNPFGLLMQLLKHLGVGYDDLENWLTRMLILVVPLLEIATKAILLTNLKHMVSCSVDPRIPEKYRKKYKQSGNPETSQERGIDIDIESIDYLDKLSMSPLSDSGKYSYFGLDGITDSYKFARADDFDAFLWFVIHKGKFPNSAIATVGDEGKLGFHTSGSRTNGASLLETLEVSFEGGKGNQSTILLGNTFMYRNGRTISMCIDNKYGENGQVLKSTIVPTTDNWNSVNWYGRRAYDLGKNLGLHMGINNITNNTKYNGKPRDYSKEFGICNLQYIDQASTDSPIIGTVNNKLKFTILPKPYVHMFKKVLFNGKGELDSSGKYSLSENDAKSILDFSGNKIKIKSGITKKDILPKLFECYPGLTVYEFNYDFVMSMKLFDARVIASTLLDSLQQTQIGISLGISHQHQEPSDMIAEIVKNIINSDDSEVEDCFYKFSNEKYEKLLSNAANKRLNKTDKFYSAKEILSSPTNGDLVKEEEILHRALTNAKVTITEGVEEKDKYGIAQNFIFDLIEKLVEAIVKAVLSPKVLLLFTVNQKIMGGKWEEFTFLDMMKAMINIIYSLVKEIRDMILQELFKLVMEMLSPILTLLSKDLVLEQLDNYAETIRDIIRNCPFIWFKFKNQLRDTHIDNVDYADIDIPPEEEKDKPNTNNC